MRSLIPLVVLLFLMSSPSNAQVFVDGRDINAMESVLICKLNISPMPLSSGMLVLVDFGEKTDSRLGDRLTTKRGDKIKIKSVVHAISYMESRGWQVSNFDVTDSDGGLEHHVIFRRNSTQSSD